MKYIVTSGLAILLSIALVALFTGVTTGILDDLITAVEDASTKEEFENIAKEFEQRRGFLSLTLPDSTLSEIEYSILEVIDFLSHNTEDEAKAAKSRLISKIREPRRLSGLNPGSIF